MVSLGSAIAAIFVFSLVIVGGYYYTQSINSGSGHNYNNTDLTGYSQAQQLQTQSNDVYGSLQQNQFVGTPFELPLVIAQGAVTIVKTLITFITTPFTVMVDVAHQYLFLPDWLAALLKSYAIFVMLIVAVGIFMRWKI